MISKPVMAPAAASVGVALSLLAFFSAAAESTVLNVKNNCPHTVWPATLGTPPLAQTGFVLLPGAAVALPAPPKWSGRVWARAPCSGDAAAGTFSCATGDCGTGRVSCDGRGGAPPATLVEFTLGGDGGKDFYDVSNVDGFNVPVGAFPSQAAGGGGCQAPSCTADINAVCPKELSQRSPGGGQVVGCRSACLAFNTDEYCCRGSYGSPGTCKPTPYSTIFKKACPQAYSYAFDDPSSTFTCAGAASYDITFCP